MPQRAGLDKAPDEVSSMFDRIAGRYDLMNGLLSFGLSRVWRQAVVTAISPEPGQTILDLAAGTGTSSYPLALAGALVFPTDLSQGMLDEGLRRHPDLPFVAADAMRLPYRNAAFDTVTMSFGLRNVVNPTHVLGELRRVTRTGGRIVICEFSYPQIPILRKTYAVYLHHIMPKLSRLSTNPVGYDYLRESILAWPSREQLASMMNAAGWGDVKWRNLTGGIVAVHRAVAQ